MSFAFSVPPGGDQWTKFEGKPLRTITKVDPLHEISPFAWPAYEATEVSARAQQASGGLARLDIARRKLGLAERKSKLFGGPDPANAREQDAVSKLRDAISPGRGESALRREAWITVIHEAAHAVAFFLDGAGVEDVGINAALVEGGRDSSLPGVRVAGGFCRSRRPVCSPAVFLAGLAAERRASRNLRKLNPDGADRIDVAQARRDLRRKGYPGNAFNRVMQDAERLVQHPTNWRAVTAPAGDLMVEIRMSGEAAEEVITKAMGIRRAG